MSEQMENPENVILADAARLTRDMQRGSEVVALLGEQVRRLRSERDAAREDLEKACAETDRWKADATSSEEAATRAWNAALEEAARLVREADQRDGALGVVADDIEAAKVRFEDVIALEPDAYARVVALIANPSGPTKYLAQATRDRRERLATSVEVARTEGRRAAFLEAAAEARQRAEEISTRWPDLGGTYPSDALMALADVLVAEANAREAT